MSLLRLLCLTLVALCSASPSAAQHWRAVNMNWRVSCAVDAGSLTQSRDTYVFRTSRNHCSGGIFRQRSELTTDTISVTQPMRYMFETTLQMITASNEPFIVFQVHDGRDGCAPPVSVRWQANGTLSFDSDYTMGRGMDGCVPNNALRSAAYTGARLRRDGTPHHFRALFRFDGQGGFDIVIEADSRRALSGNYAPASNARFVRSQQFFFKHGVYSQNTWPYELTSSRMTMLRARD
jgi:hypothetical protein